MDAGVRTLRSATTFSDNAVYAQVGIKVGTRKIARLARQAADGAKHYELIAKRLGELGFDAETFDALAAAFPDIPAKFAIGPAASPE